MERLDAIDAYVRVVDTGSFTAAARALRVTQSAVSRAVASLESWVGVSLLTRTTRRVQPTEAGRRFYEHARRVLSGVDEAAQAARGEGAQVEGRLRVCSPVSFTRLHLIPRLGEFLSRHPRLTLDLVLDDRHVDLVAAGAELAVRAGHLADSSHVARRVGASPRHLVASRAWLAQHGEPRHPTDVASLPSVGYAWSAEGELWTFRRGDEVVEVRPAPRLHVSAAEGVREAVLAGVGPAVASRWLFSRELAAGEVVALLPGWVLPPVDLWCVFPAGGTPTARARAFVAFVEEVMAALSAEAPAAR